jgi:internalin A
MKAFNWLHLTDLHFGLGGQPFLWPNVRQVFFDDLARLYERCGPWHAVLFTGDLTQTGHRDEFVALNEKVLAPLWDKLTELGSKDAVLLAIPGNHDLQRPDSKRPTAALRQLLRKDGFEEIENEFWSDPNSEYRRVVMDAFANYLAWWNQAPYRNRVTMGPGALPGDFAATLEIKTPAGAPLKIGIVGLNTTFLQLASGDFRKRLACDSRQLHSAWNEDAPRWVEGHAACILFSHQGPEWFNQRSMDDIYPEINPAGRFAAHLFGHMHENVVRTTLSGGGKPLRQWQGCSLFGMEKFGEPPAIDRRHGYCSGRIEFAELFASIRQWPRRAVKDANGWRFERDAESCVLAESDGGTEAENVSFTGVTPKATSAQATICSSESGSIRSPFISSAKAECRTSANIGKFRWPHDDPTLKAYCEGVCKAHSHIRFVEIPYLKDVSDVELDALYVEPRFSSQEIHPDIPPFRWPKSSPAVPTLRDHRNLILLGDPGSGKSTLISCISWQLCRPKGAISNAWVEAFGGCVPLPIVLRELHLKADLTWESLLDAFINHRIGKLLPNRASVEALLKEGRGIVLLDGLDEVGNLTVRKKLRDAVHSGMAANPDSRWVLTSRIVGYELVPFHIKVESVSSATDTGAEVIELRKNTQRVRSQVADLLYLSPFNDEQIRAFSVNWYKQHEKDENLVQSSAQDFVQAIRENDGTQRLARIPYLLTLMALIHHKNARLPHGRTELYERIATAYLESIDLRRHLDQLPYSLAQKKRWLAEVAYRMQLRRAKKTTESNRGEILATKAEVQKWLRGAMAESGVRNTKDESETLLDYFAQRSGLLLPRGEGKFAFMHLSLQEYFAACFLEPRLTASRFTRDNPKAEPTDEQLRFWANDEAWRESFVLLFELLSEKSAAETGGFLEHLYEDRLELDAEGRQGEAAGLLAELATDPFVVLDTETRRQIRQQCWRWVFGLRNNGSGDLRRRSRFYDPLGNNVVRSLVREAQGDLQKAWKMASITRPELRRVEKLDLGGCLGVFDISPIRLLPRLTHLSLHGCTGVSVLAPLAEMKNLRELNLEGCSGVTNIDALKHCGELRTLLLGAQVDLAPLSTLGLLTELHLHYAGSRETDLTPLAGSSALRFICVGRDSKPVKILADLRAHPEKVLSEGVRRVVFGEPVDRRRRSTKQRNLPFRSRINRKSTPLS